jgi:hypothetical protein
MDSKQPADAGVVQISSDSSSAASSSTIYIASQKMAGNVLLQCFQRYQPLAYAAWQSWLYQEMWPRTADTSPASVVHSISPSTNND